MRRVFLLAFLLVLAIGAITPVEVAAADGAESSDSITSFSETTSDDAMLYPDCEQAEGNDYTLHSLDFLDGTISIHTMDCTTDDFVSWNYAAGSTSNDADTLNMSVSVAGTACEWFDGYDSNYHNFLAFYLTDASGGPWTLEYYAAGWQDYSQVNFTTADIGSVVEFAMSSWPNHESATYQFIFESIGWLQLDWIICSDTPHYELDTWTGFTESFANVSDWLIMDGEGDDTFSSDGDLLHFESKTDSEDDGESVYSNVPSLVGQYLEIRYRLNTTSLATFAVGTYSSDGGLAGNINWFGMTITTSWTTSKFSINSDTVIESVRLYIYHVTGQPPVDLQVDYLRIGPANEMGWAHDGSTTAGVTDDATADNSYSVTSDGDVLTLTASRDGGASGNGYATFYFPFDTTATAIGLENTYYQSIAASFNVTGTPSNYRMRANWDSKYAHVYQPTKDTALTTYRRNVAAGSLAYNEYVDFEALLAPGWNITWHVDYVKAYSIANFTVTNSGAGVNDVTWVESGVLNHTEVIGQYVRLSFDPALSTNTATYNVWNATVADPGGGFRFREYVGAWKYFDVGETRGELTSGTMTSFEILLYATMTVSAIKFIEDGTAPAVVRSSSTPNDPEDDEAVTLSAVITDAVEVYSVKFNAIVYPTGFSDVDYSANEQADNLWNYTFSSLDAGYYCFKIIASDGANTNALTEYAYIELTVREAAIMVEEITLIGAGEDFLMMTFSARINRDCSFTIYEESASSPESDTHTGSVTAPSFNLAWTKLDVEDSNVNFTIKFVSGSLTYNYTSQYQVAQTTFYVSTVTQMVSLDTVTVTGRITKLGAYQVYDDLDVLKDYGSITDLDFKVQFTRWGGYDEQNHDFAIKFTNGTQTCWYNSSFYAFKKPVVAPFPIEDKNALYAFQVSFWTLIAVVAVGGMVAVDFYRKEVK